MQNSTSCRGMDVANVSVAPLSIGKEYRGGLRRNQWCDLDTGIGKARASPRTVKPSVTFRSTTTKELLCYAN